MSDKTCTHAGCYADTTCAMGHINKMNCECHVSIKLDIGCGFTHHPGYLRIDKDPRCEPDLCVDLTTCSLLGLEFMKHPSGRITYNSIDEIRCHDFMEHLYPAYCIRLMEDFYKALKPGGILDIQVPSTDGRGAFQNPLHVSFWNRNSFLYYTKPECIREIEFNGKFEIEAMIDKQTDIGVTHTRARLRKCPK